MRLLAILGIIGLLSALCGNAAALEGQQNVTGTYSCTCEGGTGSCTVAQKGGALLCIKGKGTCTGSCDFETRSTGVNPVNPAGAPPPTTTGPGGRPSAKGQ
jgi:hypothetical protein